MIYANTFQKYKIYTIFIVNIFFLRIEIIPEIAHLHVDTGFGNTTPAV